MSGLATPSIITPRPLKDAFAPCANWTASKNEPKHDHNKGVTVYTTKEYSDFLRIIDESYDNTFEVCFHAPIPSAKEFVCFTRTIINAVGYYSDKIAVNRAC